jgi:hypothetical protein
MIAIYLWMSGCVELALEQNFEVLAQINKNSEDSRMQKAIQLIIKVGPKYLNLTNISRKDPTVLMMYKSMLRDIVSLRSSEIAHLGAEVAFCARKAGDLATADQILSNIPHYFWY